jgi:cytochrome d ubiquinol oxidase subunit II
MSREIFDKWFSLPNLFLLAPVPAITLLLFVSAGIALRRLSARLEQGSERGNRVPFASTIGIFVLAFLGLAYSLFPWIVPQRLDIWQAAAAPGSLAFILVGVVIVLPMIIAYTVFSYWVFRGKSRDLEYG